MPVVTRPKKSSSKEEEETPPSPEPAPELAGKGDESEEDRAAKEALAVEERFRVTAATLKDFTESIGRLGPAPTPEQVDAWRDALSSLTLPELQSVLLLDLQVPATEVRGQSSAACLGIALAAEVLARPPPPLSKEQLREARLDKLLGIAESFEGYKLEQAKLAEEQERKFAVRLTALQAEQSAVAEGLRASVLAANERAERAEKLAKEKTRSKDDSVEGYFQQEVDDRPFVTHFKSEEARELDGKVVINPHQDPPRPLGCSFKPHLFDNLQRSPLGEEIWAHAAAESQAEYVTLKSGISFFWDANQYFADWVPVFGASNPQAKLAAEALQNSQAEIYKLFNNQLSLISIRAHAKSQNPTWSLTPEQKKKLELLERERKSFKSLYGVEGDVPENHLRILAKYEKQVSTAEFTVRLRLSMCRSL